MKGVIRIEQPDKNSFGWQGRLYFNIDGQRPPSKFFSDKVHGGKKAAEAKCAAWVKRQHTKHKQLYLEDAPVFSEARTPTGVVGVYETPGGKLLVRATYQGRSVSKTLKDDATLETAERAQRRLYKKLISEA
jgi:hypothetical protein